MSSLPNLQPDGSFAPAHNCMLTAEDILGGGPSSQPDPRAPSHSPTAMFLQPGSHSMQPQPLGVPTCENSKDNAQAEILDVT